VVGEAAPGPVHSDGHQAEVDSLNADKGLDSLGLEGHTAGVGRLEHGEVPFVRMAAPLESVVGIWDPVLTWGVVLESPAEEDTGDACHHEADNHDQSETLRRCLAMHCGLAALACRSPQIDLNREYPIYRETIP
jgi:hypothetical protein